MTPLILTLAGICAVRIAASFLTSQRTNTGPTFVMVAAAFVLAFDLGRAFIGGPAAIAQIAPPFEGEWLVLQGGRSPLQNHHLVAYNQRFALDLVRLDNGHIFTDTDDTGNAGVHSWEQPLLSPADGKVVVARDEMEDADGANVVTDAADAAGNVIVIELDSGLFVVLAHLRHGTFRVSEGDRVRKGDPLALVGNSGNTTMPHLHLQVQTQVDVWHSDNRSVPFAFEPDGHVLVRNDRVGDSCWSRTWWGRLEKSLKAYEDSVPRSGSLEWSHADWGITTSAARFFLAPAGCFAYHHGTLGI